VSKRTRAQIVGWGRYVPHRVVTNEELSQQVDTTDEWIVERTGIRERRIAAPDETTSTLAILAAEQALAIANADPLEIDLIIVGTATPDYQFPSTACLVQRAIGATNAAAFDLAAGCTGFIYGLASASQAIESGACQQALVIGAETLSRIMNWKDRNTCVLFGDGAGAVLLRAGPGPGGVMSTVLGADGGSGEYLILPAGGSKQPATAETVAAGLHYIHMDGRRIFKYASKIIPSAMEKLLKAADAKLEDIDLVIAHQANLRIIQSANSALGLPDGKMFVNIDKYGNTSAASIPIGLCEAVEQGKIKSGSRVALVGFGAGLTWGAAMLEWSGPPSVKRDRRWLVASQHRTWARILRRLHQWLMRAFAIIPSGAARS
jgi:3-oxoacyl-[acyl-carrier-protein] synthase-3